MSKPSDDSKPEEPSSPLVGRFSAFFSGVKSKLSAENIKAKVKSIPKVIDSIVEKEKQQFEHEKEITALRKTASPVSSDTDNLFWLSIPTELLDDDDFKADLKKMTRTRDTYTQPPPVDCSFVFNFQDNLPRCLSALKAEPFLERARFIAVPKFVHEQQFWCNFFYHMERLIQVHIQKDPGGMKSIFEANSSAGLHSELSEEEVKAMEDELSHFQDKVLLLSELLSMIESPDELVDNSMVNDLIGSCRQMRERTIEMLRLIPARSGVKTSHQHLVSTARTTYDKLNSAISDYEEKRGPSPPPPEEPEAGSEDERGSSSDAPAKPTTSTEGFGRGELDSVESINDEEEDDGELGNSILGGEDGGNVNSGTNDGDADSFDETEFISDDVVLGTLDDVDDSWKAQMHEELGLHGGADAQGLDADWEEEIEAELSRIEENDD